tara:strand:+ start:81 stop:368 length:288 start_codon:yes stop_codon:yes gene_type:complete
MKVWVESMTPMKTQHGGHDIFRIDGYYEDEFGKLVKGKCFIDPKYDNAKDWLETLERIKESRGNWVELDNIKMKSKDKGVWNADCKPVVTNIIPK